MAVYTLLQAVGLTFDVITDIFKGEEDSRRIFCYSKTSSARSRVFMTTKIWDDMHWADRMHWHKLAVMTVLKPGEKILKMGARDMVVK
jgi:hypothetical protein